MRFDNWIRQAREHWKQHLPNMYRELEATGKLEKALKKAANQTAMDLYSLENSGYEPHEAWEMVRGRYLFLPEEDSVKERRDREGD